MKWLKWQIGGTGLSFSQCQYCENLLLMTKQENKNVILFITAFTFTYGWDFCWSCFLLSLNLSVLSPDVTLAAKLHFFFFLGRLLSRRNVNIPQVKKTTQLFVSNVMSI